MPSRSLSLLTATIALLINYAAFTFVASAAPQLPENLVWTSPSHNSSESMPCGGGDIGLNAWVENGDLLFYIARSDTFDENNSMLKQGRVRVRLSPNPFTDGDSFRQELKLEEGAILISGKNKEGVATNIRLWADVFNPVIHLETQNNQKLSAQIFYENWRHEDRPMTGTEYRQSTYKRGIPDGIPTKKDQINYEGKAILFYHRNDAETVFDVTVKNQELETLKPLLPNPLKHRTFGGVLKAEGFKPAGTSSGTYAKTNYKAWKLETEQPLQQWRLTIQLHTAQTEDIAAWKNVLDKPLTSDKQKNLDWWKDFHKRSFIRIQSNDGTGKGAEISRNYLLFRYMLACNATGDYPTKFNGGLLTFDPVYTNKQYPFTPDFYNWGGGSFTAQNQRLVYFPMLKSGDFDFMKPQLEFYKRLLPVAEARSKVYWGHGGASFVEQVETFGLLSPAYFGWKRPEKLPKGVENNSFIDYLWDTSLEFCFMILEKERYTGADISTYIPLIESCVRFFDEHYQYEAKLRGEPPLDKDGKLTLYPGTGAETYKMVLNSTSTIAALQTVASRLLELPENYLDTEKRNYYVQFLKRLPEIRTREIKGKTVIAPAWKWQRVNNTECPQLYPVYPWGIYGIGRPGFDVAVDTYKFDPAVRKFRNHVSWTQHAIFAARLGLVDEAKDLVIKKLQNSGRRFPAFWGPGHDWVPDHNWGGSGMIALQEMLLQVDGKKLFLLPTWPVGWDVHFKLHAPYNTTVECVVEGGKVTELIVTPKEREKDIIVKK